LLGLDVARGAYATKGSEKYDNRFNYCTGPLGQIYIKFYVQQTVNVTKCRKQNSS